MIKEKITKEEVAFVKKKFNKDLFNSLFIMSFILIIKCLPIYFLFYFLGLFIFNYRGSLLSIYIISVLGLVIANFLYSIIIFNKKIKDQKIYKITDDFRVQKKDDYTITSDIGSDNSYFRLYLINNFDNIRKGIYVSEEDYKKIKENEIITIVYFEVTGIILEALHHNEKLKYANFFSVKKWCLPF